MRPSRQLLATFEYARGSSDWFSSEDLAQAKNISGATATARTHLKRLAEAGILDLRRFSPAYLYRLAPDGEKQELAQYLSQLV